MKTKYLLMIFDTNNILLGFNSFLFNTKKQGLKYLKLLDTTNKKIIFQPLKVLNTKEVKTEIEKFSKIVGQ
jgi:hypothetical protein